MSDKPRHEYYELLESEFTHGFSIDDNLFQQAMQLPVYDGPSRILPNFEDDDDPRYDEIIKERMPSFDELLKLTDPTPHPPAQAGQRA